MVFLTQGIAGENTRRVMFEFTVAKIPEPGTLALLGLGLVGVLASRSRRRE